MSMYYTIKIRLLDVNMVELSEQLQTPIIEYLEKSLYDFSFPCSSYSNGVDTDEFEVISIQFPNVIFEIEECKTEDYNFSEDDHKIFYFINGKYEYYNGFLKYEKDVYQYAQDGLNKFIGKNIKNKNNCNHKYVLINYVNLSGESEFSCNVCGDVKFVKVDLND